MLVTAIKNIIDKHLALKQRVDDNLKDTGWRKLTSTRLDASHVMIRRIGTVCYLSIGGGRWDTFTIATGSRGVVKINVLQVPEGFRSLSPVLGAVTKDGNEIIGSLMLTSTKDGNWLQLKNVPAEHFEILRPYMLIYPTHEPFPTVLPGSAV